MESWRPEMPQRLYQDNVVYDMRLVVKVTLTSAYPNEPDVGSEVGSLAMRNPDIPAEPVVQPDPHHRTRAFRLFRQAMGPAPVRQAEILPFERRE